jgi:hypothetical protein
VIPVKCDEKYLGWMEGWKEVKQYTLPPVERGYNNVEFLKDGSRNNHMGGLLILTTMSTNKCDYNLTTHTIEFDFTPLPTHI